MLDILQFEFMRNAVFVAMLASIVCGIVGSFVVVKKIGMVSGGIAHASFGGLGIGYFLGINPLLCLIPFSILSALGIGLISKKTETSEDTAVGIFWAIGMSLGVIFISLTKGYTDNLFSYLFGNILTVSQSDVYLLIILDLIVLVTVIVCYRAFMVVSFDEEYAKISGVNSFLFYLLLLILVAISVVILMRVVGIILVIALLTLPATIVKQYTKNLKIMIIFSIFLTAILLLVGLYLSYIFDLPSGATIILLAGMIFVLSSSRKYLRFRN